MYPPWHGTSTPAVSATTPGSRIDPSSQPSSQSAYQMSQVRWLPSVISQTNAHSHNSLPTISSNLRMGQHQHQQPPQQQQPPHQQSQAQAHSHQHHRHHHHHQSQQQQTQQQRPTVSVVVDTRQPQPSSAPPAPESVDSEDSDRSDTPGGTPGVRNATGPDGLGEADFAPSPHRLRGEGRHGRRSGAGASIGVRGRNNNSTVNREDEDLDAEIMSSGAGGEGDGGKEGDASRKHGKRLTTKEEVSLFEICNRHAAEFGQRSNLCKWWMTVTMEFTRGQSHPYSWHSVRRKVELVTKQRMKFLEEQREKGGSETDDLSNPRWRAVVDTWIPTWQRWEEAEARRIEKRDSRRPRKRKWAEGWDLSNTDAWRAPSTPLSDLRNSQSQTPTNNHTHNPPAAAAAPPPPTPPVVSTPVRLPPGFDNMFSSQTNVSSISNSYNPHQAHPSSSTTNTPSGGDSTVMAAVLETLGKLNRHLDAASTSEPRSSPVVPSLTPNVEPRAGIRIHRSSSHSNLEDARSGTAPLDEPISPTPPHHFTTDSIKKLKEELRREMREEIRTELEKDMATLEERLDTVQRTQDMILEMLRQEPT